MTPGQLSRRSEFTFVYMIPPQNVMPARVTPVRNLATVSCKRETSERFGVKSDCW